MTLTLSLLGCWSVVATASAPAANSQSGWVAMILRELARSQVTGLLLDVAEGVLLGAGVGILVAMLACWAFSRMGWYDMRIRFARFLRWSVFTLVVLLSAVFFSVAGFWSGAIHGCERVLTKSQLGTGAFPLIADAIADGMAWVQIRAELPSDADTNAVAAKLELFRQGQWELNAARFQGQLDQIREETVTGLIAQLEQSALARTPQLKAGVTEELLHQFLTGLGRLMVEKKAASDLKNWGADRVYSAIRNQLAAEAAKTGNASTIARRELSAFLVREGIVPSIMKPIRQTGRAQQLMCIGLAALAIVVPPCCIRLASGRRGGGGGGAGAGARMEDGGLRMAGV
jgi:hypothetical protein